MVKNTWKAQFVAVLLCMVCISRVVSGDSLQKKCSNEFTKVSECLAFATGKADAPSKQCCDGVTAIKDDDPVCLCYIIQLIHNGTDPQLKNLGLQEAKLLQLPSACKLTNASLSDCPKLLDLPPNSTEAAIFTNPPTSNTTTPASTPGSSSSTTANSNGFKHVPGLAGPIALAAAIFFCAFPSGIGSRFFV